VTGDGARAAVAKRYPKLQPAPFGRGVFAQVRTTRKPTSPDKIEEWSTTPFIAGAQLSYSWADLEPTEGRYRWDLVESDLEPWAREGKKCWIEIRTAEKRDREGGRGTPRWVFEKGIPKVGAEGTATYPVFWDDGYQRLWATFVRAFAKRFDGDPRLEFISTGGYSSGHEPNLSSWDNERLKSQWEKAGFDGMTPNGTYMNKAIKPILKLFADTFRKTPVAQTVHVRSDFDRAMNEYAAKLRFILISNGLAAKIDAHQRQLWRERRENLGVKVGFAEWGPSGRELSAEMRQLKKQRKRAMREGGSGADLRGQRDRSTLAPLLVVYRRAIGADSDPELKPASRISYLPLGDRVPEVETQEEWLAALRWASEHLEK
jgi:hypothetical protein